MIPVEAPGGFKYRVVLPYFVISGLCNQYRHDFELNLLSAENWIVQGNLLETIAIQSLYYFIKAYHYFGEGDYIKLADIRPNAYFLDDELKTITIKKEYSCKIGDTFNNSVSETTIDDMKSSNYILKTGRQQESIDYILKSENLVVLGQCKGTNITKNHDLYSPVTTTLSLSRLNKELTSLDDFKNKIERPDRKIIYDIIYFARGLSKESIKSIKQPLILTTYDNFDQVVGPVFGARKLIYDKVLEHVETTKS